MGAEEVKMSAIYKIANEINQELFAGQIKNIKLEIKPNIRGGYLGKTYLSIKKKLSAGEYIVDSLIGIQKRALADKDLFKRIIIHELIHFLDYQIMDLDEKIMTVKLDRESHGEFFKKWLDKANALHGDGFVTIKASYSDKEANTKEYYLVIATSVRNPEKMTFAKYFKNTPKINMVVDKIKKERKAKVIKSGSSEFLDSYVAITKWLTVENSDELSNKLKDLYQKEDTIIERSYIKSMNKLNKNYIFLS